VSVTRVKWGEEVFLTVDQCNYYVTHEQAGTEV
jgi:hypothetical protein